MNPLWLLMACAEPSSEYNTPPDRMAVARRFHTLTVDCDGGADFTSIRDALDRSVSGDTILVEPCTYEGFSFGGKSVLIQSTDGPTVTTILARPGEPAIKAKHGEGAGTEVVGFTITGGGGEDEPAIEVQFSALTLRNDIVSGNVGTSTLYSYYGHVLVEGTVFEDNTPSEGWIIRERRGMTLLVDSTVRCDGAPTGYFTEHGAAFADRSTFECAGATAVEVFHADSRIQRSVLDGLLLVENEGLDDERTVVEGSVLLAGATLRSGAVTLRNIVSTGAITMTDSAVVLEASVVTGATCGVDVTASTTTIRDSTFWDNGADACGITTPVGTDGSIQADPLFTDTTGRDFHLAPGSPCLDAGPDEYGYADPDGTRNDQGAYGGPLSIGGGW